MFCRGYAKREGLVRAGSSAALRMSGSRLGGRGKSNHRSFGCAQDDRVLGWVWKRSRGDRASFGFAQDDGTLWVSTLVIRQPLGSQKMTKGRILRPR